MTELKFELRLDSLQRFSSFPCTLLSLCKNQKRSEGLIETVLSCRPEQVVRDIKYLLHEDESIECLLHARHNASSEDIVRVFRVE